MLLISRFQNSLAAFYRRLKTLGNPHPQPLSQIGERGEMQSGFERRLSFPAGYGKYPVLLLVLFSLCTSCARLPPNQNSLSGRRLVVEMRFKGPVDPRIFYFFLINYDTSTGVAGNPNAPGPVAVYVPPFGNGFATGSGGGQIGFTDFVRFSILEQNGIPNLYHVLRTTGQAETYDFTGGTLNVQLNRDLSNPASRTLKFEIDLSQLVRDANGQKLPDDQANALARQIQFLQVNILATDRIPATDDNLPKLVDAFGESAQQGNPFAFGSGVQSFLTLDLRTVSRIYRSDDPQQLGSNEPLYEDVFGGYDPSVDLEFWSIQLQDFGR
jgi:hypothetical protein